MKSNEATKALDLVNALTSQVKKQNEIDITDATAPLRLHLQKAALCADGNRTAGNLLPLIKSYLKRAGKDRPLMGNICHSKKNEQFIVDGYTAFLFHKDRPEFGIFGKTKKEESVDILQIMDIKEEYIPSEEDKQINTLVWNNIHKFGAYLKSINEYEDGAQIYIFNRIFNYSFIETSVKICGDLSQYKLTGVGDVRPIRLSSKNISAIMLPCRAEDDALKFKERTLAFLKAISENSKPLKAAA